LRFKPISINNRQVGKDRTMQTTD